jgi:hypothetical protein
VYSEPFLTRVTNVDSFHIIKGRQKEIGTKRKKRTKVIIIIIIIITIIQFLYVSTCQQRVTYNRRALKVYITKERLMLEL